MTELFIEQFIRPNLPKKITVEVSKALKDFPKNINYYDTSGTIPQFISYGDGINTMPSFEKIKNDNFMVKLCLSAIQKKIGTEYTLGKERNTLSLIISNPCDISPENPRPYFVPNIQYAPILNLFKYKQGLEKAGIPGEVIADHIHSIKMQSLTNIFYIPQGQIPESIVFLDKINCCKYNDYDHSLLIKDRKFTLSLLGGYILITKLGIHFSRIENTITI